MTIAPASARRSSAGHGIRVAAFTGSETISSRRFRLMQYIPLLSSEGIAVDEFIARHGSWPPAERWARPLWLASTLADRVIPTLRSRRYDLTFLQREFVSTMHTLERFTGRPRVLDVDDAVWLNGPRAKRSFASLASSCDGVICGNTYIADAVQRWNPRIVVLPTAVDTERFAVAPRVPGQKKIIGWSGLYAGSKYLVGIEDALFRVLRARPDAVLRVVSDARPDFRRISSDMYEFIRWSPENEVRAIQEMDIGLMPIDDTEWSKGKCSYKMLLYMSCAIPVVVSPYGMNREVLAHRPVGHGPRNSEQWCEAIVSLLDDECQRGLMGTHARSVIEEHYSLKKIGHRLAEFLQNVRQTSARVQT